MSKRYLLIIAIVGIASMFLATAIYAGTTVADVVKMENKKYEKHKKSIVDFSHKKHNIEYKAGCGECHHDAEGKPLNDLKMGDEVQNCIECHTKAGRPPRAKKGAPKLSTKEKMEYHAYAIHVNCKGCHKAANKKSGTRAAPTSCSKCHPKKK
ncbi:MAG: cytochrome c3 family protein [Thermodesulfobacteriota bacterium]|nr:cytochrome c3 family protein [Thermodesulfobacteriota bacterium]